MAGERKFGAYLVRFSRILLFLVGIAIIVPILIGLIVGIQAGITLSFILSAYALQAAVPPIGIALGLTAPIVLVFLACFAVGVVLGIYEICRTLGASSKRVSAFIGKVEQKTEQYPMIRKYGPVTCVLIAWVPGIGLYGTPVISWMLGWKRVPSVICTAAGFLIAAVFVMFFASRINEVLHFAALAGLMIYTVTLSVAMGLTTPVPALAGAARKPLLLPLLFVNFVIVPTAAYLLSSSLSLPSGASAGLILISLSAGAPSLYATFRKEGGTIASLAPLILVMSIIGVIIIPVAFPFMVPVAGAVPVWSVVYLSLFMLLPLITALYVRPRYEKAAALWGPRLDRIAWIAWGVMVVTMIVLFTTSFFALPGMSSLLSAVLLALVAFGAGYAAGGNNPDARQFSAQVTAPRNMAAALLVAFLAMKEPPVMAMVLFCGLVGLIPFFIRWWSFWRARKRATT